MSGIVPRSGVQTRRGCPHQRNSIVSAQIICVETILRRRLVMWSAEHSIETTAAPEAIWRLWAGVAGWPGWNADLELAELSGRFAAGSTITMTPHGQEPIELAI